MNKVILIGRLTKDVEQSTTQQGVSVARFSLAVKRPFSQDTDFFNCIAWRSTADQVATYLSKGSQCAVIGYVQNRSYEKDGQKRTVTEIVADSVEFLSPKSEKVVKSIDDLEEVDDDGGLPF